MAERSDRGGPARVVWETPDGPRPRRKYVHFLARRTEMDVSATSIDRYHGSYLMPSLEQATVADAMHPAILSCQADASLMAVARIMATHHVHCVAVLGLSPRQPGETPVWGIISDLDLLRAGIRTNPDESAGAMALQPVISVEPSTSLREAGELMLAHGASHVVVIDPNAGQPMGILSTLDFAGILAWGEA
jgi:CBS domain-containing protein